jgi:hypothetical protein
MQASASDSGAGAGGSQAELYQAQAHVEGAQEGEPFLYRLFVGWVRGAGCLCRVVSKNLHGLCLAHKVDQCGSPRALERHPAQWRSKAGKAAATGGFEGRCAGLDTECHVRGSSPCCHELHATVRCARDP